MTDPLYMREKSSSVTLTAVVEGLTENFGTWQKLDGGDVKSDATKTFPGGGKPEVVVPGGSASTDDITLTRQFDRARDASHDYARLRELTGKGYTFTITEAYLGYDNIAFGTPNVDDGALTGVSRPKTDANSDAIKEFTITIAVKGK